MYRRSLRETKRCVLREFSRRCQGWERGIPLLEFVHLPLGGRFLVAVFTFELGALRGERPPLPDELCH
jgi:hypothetical protein